MILACSRNRRWLSNSWLVGDRPGGHAVLVDSGGPVEPLREALREHRLELDAVLCTHHHVDHVLHNEDWKRSEGCPVCGHPREEKLFGGLDRRLEDGDELEAGGLRIRALHIPGHTLGQLAFLVNGSHLFTGDTLFRGSVGGTVGPGHTTFEDLQHSILEKLFRLPPETEVLPGHMEATTLAREWEENPFLRLWRGLEAPQAEAVTVFGRPATLLLRARDYDGGSKCQVRFEDDGSLAVVPGSRVEPSVRKPD